MPDELDCIFCQIVAGDAPSTKLFEDELTIVIMDIFPWTPGHCLVITKEHAATIFELSLESAEAVMRTARTVAPAIRDGLKPDGLNLVQANGRAAWQTVDHFHLHMVPRYLDDGLMPPRIPGPGDTKEISGAAEKIRGALGS